MGVILGHAPYYGSLLEGLARQQPAAIVFDILFTDPQLDHEQDDLYFIEVARASARTYLPMVRLCSGLTMPASVRANSTR